MNKMRFFIIIIILFSLVSGIAGAGEETSVVVREQVFAQGPRVYLFEVAQITGGTEQQRQALSGVYLCSVPAPGQHVRISRNKLIQKITAEGITMDTIHLDSPRRVLVYPSRGILLRGDLIRQARECLRENKVSYTAIAPADSHLPGRIEIPGGTVDYSSDYITGEDGPARVRVTVIIDGSPWESFDFIPEIPSPAPAPKAPPPVTSDGVEISPPQTASHIREVIPDAGIRIRRGDPVKVLIHRKNMIISVNGIAVGSGRVGDRIRIRTFDDGGMVNAVIMDQATARIEL